MDLRVVADVHWKMRVEIEVTDRGRMRMLEGELAERARQPLPAGGGAQQHSGDQQQASGKKNDDVVDADFEEVK